MESSKPDLAEDQAVCATVSVGAVTFFALAAVFLAGAAFFAIFTGAFFAVAFFTAVFLATTGLAFAAALFAAHRFFKAATMFALPALLSFRLAFGAPEVAGAGGSGFPRIFAHRSCWASFMRLRAAAENFRRLIVGLSGVAAGVGLLEPPSNMERSSVIWVSI